MFPSLPFPLPSTVDKKSSTRPPDDVGSKRQETWGLAEQRKHKAGSSRALNWLAQSRQLSRDLHSRVRRDFGGKCLESRETSHIPISPYPILWPGHPLPISPGITCTRCCPAQMTNLLTVLPNFDTKPFSHIIPSLEKALISSVDLLTLEPIDVAKRAQVPTGEVKKLANALLEQLRGEPASNHEDDNTLTGGLVFTNGEALLNRWDTISTLDDFLDERLGGGVPRGYLTEITGER